MTELSEDGCTPAEQLERISRGVADAGRDRSRRAGRNCAANCARPASPSSTPRTCPRPRCEWLQDHFLLHVFPLLTPLAVDPAHPFPFIPNLGFTLALELAHVEDGRPMSALVRFPNRIERFMKLPDALGRRRASLRHPRADHRRLQPLAVSRVSRSSARAVFRVIRDSDIEVEEEAEDLVRLFESALKLRRRGSVIRLEIEAGMPPALRAFVTGDVDVLASGVVYIDGMLGARRTCRGIVALDRPDLKFAPFIPRFPERIRENGGDCFAAIRHKDFVVHHPYESFDVVVQFLTRRRATRTSSRSSRRSTAPRPTARSCAR